MKKLNNLIGMATVLIAFCSGFVWSIEKLEDIYKFPLSSTVIGSIHGFGIVIIAEFIAIIIPFAHIPLLFSCCASLMHYGHKLFNP